VTRSLIVLPNWVGDVVMAEPVLAALAAADREIVVLAKPGLAPLIDLLPTVASMVPREPDDSSTIDALRRAACDEAIILPNSFRSALLTYRAGIPRRWGYRSDLRSPLLSPAVRRPRERRIHQTEDYRDLLTAMDVPCPAAWTPRLHLSTEALEDGRRLVARAGLESTDRPLVGFFPGAEFGPSKRWPWQNFATLAEEVYRRVGGARPVILAGPKEVWLAVRVHEESGHRHPVIGPDLDLACFASVLAQLDLLVTNDSGPMHLAAALGVPCVALFGPTDPRRTRPAGENHEVLYTDRWCSPCFRRRCPLVRHRCLRDIEVGTVFEACARLLKAGG